MRYLLERLAARPDTSGGRPEPFDLEAAVAAQIQRIVSARPRIPSAPTPGGKTTVLEFGMPSIVEFAQGSKSQLERYAARLARLIRRYEPRLRHPSVTLEPVPSGLAPWRLVVSGVLGSDADAQAFRFELSRLDNE
jgi:type VI secretion system lysozyme-like protein